MLNVNPLKRFSNEILDVFCAFWLALILLTNFPIFFDFYNNTLHAPKYYLFTILLGVVYFAMAPLHSLDFIKEPIVHWSIFFILLVIVTCFRLSLADDDVLLFEAELNRLQRIIMFPAIAFICWRARPTMLWYLLPIACAIIASSNIYDLLAPGQLGPVLVETGSGRADGFYRNANPAAEAALMSILIFRNRCPKTLFIILYVLAGLGVVATFSRSGMVLWVMMGAYMSFSGKLPKFSLVVPLLAVLAVNVFYDQIDDFLHSIPEYENSADNMMGRLSFFTFGADASGSAVEQLEDDVRSEIAILAIQSAFEKPLLGHGYDYEDPVYQIGPHNLILKFFHSYGVLGLVAWAWLVLCMFLEERRQYGIFCAVTASFVWFSFFSHNIMDNVFWYVVIAVALFSERSTRRSGRFKLGLNGSARFASHEDSHGGRRRRRRRKRRSV